MLKRIAWAEVAKTAAKYSTILLIACGAMWLLLGEWSFWRHNDGARRPPIVARATARVAEAPQVKIPEAPLVAPALPPKVVKRIAKDYGKPVSTLTEAGEVVDSSGAIIPGGLEVSDLVLTEVEIPRLPEGGGALVTRKPGGGVEVTVRAAPRRFFELRSEFSVGALVDPTGGGDWRGYARWSGLRLGRVHAIVEAGGLRHGGSSGGYVMVGAELRFGGGS